MKKNKKEINMTTEKTNLQGVWQTVEITTTGPDASTYPAEPVVHILTGNY